MLGFLLITGAIVGVAIGAFGHPKIYRSVFGGKGRSLDH